MADEKKSKDVGTSQQGADVETGQPVTPIVDWDDSEMRSSYANAVNASATREEVNIFFGTNQTWKTTERRQVHVRLNDRIVLTPHAAKRLWMLLGGVLKEYESRFGSLEVGSTSPRGASDDSMETAAGSKGK